MNSARLSTPTGRGLEKVILGRGWKPSEKRMGMEALLAALRKTSIISRCPSRRASLSLRKRERIFLTHGFLSTTSLTPTRRVGGGMSDGSARTNPPCSPHIPQRSHPSLQGGVGSPR